MDARKPGRRYGLFGVSAYPKRQDMAESQRRSMAHWASVAVVLLCVTVLALLAAGTHSSPGLTVSFDPMGGSAAPAQSVPFGGNAEEPDQVVRPGYALVCWSLTPDGREPWDFAGDAVEENLTLYAVWEADGT